MLDRVQGDEARGDVFLGLAVAVAVGALYENWDGARSGSVARHNVMSSTAVAQDSAATETGVLLEKEWLSMRDARVREAHSLADGQTVGSESAFIVDGEALQFPRDPAGSVGNTANCRCQEIFSPLDTMVTPEEVSGQADRLRDEAKAEEEELTKRLEEIARKREGQMEGLEFSIKTKASLKRKIADKVKKGGPGMSETQAADQIQDALRYTMVVDDANYATALRSTLADFKKAGITPNKQKLYWVKGNNYMGGNYTFNLPSGQVFELQFHTPTSFAVKEPLLHNIYQRWRVLNPKTTLAKGLDAEMRAIAAEIPFPPNLSNIPGYPEVLTVKSR